VKGGREGSEREEGKKKKRKGGKGRGSRASPSWLTLSLNPLPRRGGSKGGEGKGETERGGIDRMKRGEKKNPPPPPLSSPLMRKQKKKGKNPARMEERGKRGEKDGVTLLFFMLGLPIS